MGMTRAYGAGDEAPGLATIHRALDLGVGDDPPGVKLMAQDIEELDNAVSRDAVYADRYPEPMIALLNP
jgi:hypothetical protein